MIKNLSETPSIVSECLHELRDVELQKDQQRFAENIERLGMITGYEVSKLLSYADHQTTTSLGTANTPLIKDAIVLATILRAGLPLQRGIKQVIKHAELSFVAAGRKPETAGGVEIELSYVATPPLTGKVLVIADTMIATGKSLVDTYAAMTKQYGIPLRTIIVGVIASQDGLDYVSEQVPNVALVVCAIDTELNDKFFIVPGLGDAGDLLYGPKAIPQTR
jgi:uracil phosphoribosyltransferase